VTIAFAHSDTPLLVLGGSFDPIHLAHEQLLNAVRTNLAQDCVAALMPAYRNPLKQSVSAGAEHRLKMINMVASRNNFEVLTLELEREGASYTVDTLTQLRQSLGPTRPILIVMGADTLDGLPKWREWRQIPTLAHVVVVNRGDRQPSIDTSVLAQFPRGVQQLTALCDAPHGAIALSSMPQSDVSSTEIRASQEGNDWAQLVSEDVAAYIKQHTLYTGS